MRKDELANHHAQKLPDVPNVQYNTFNKYAVYVIRSDTDDACLEDDDQDLKSIAEGGI